MNKLADYLISKPMTQSAFGRLVGACQSVVSQWVNGNRRPGLEHALMIEKATRGAVPAACWMGPMAHRRWRSSPSGPVELHRKVSGK